VVQPARAQDFRFTVPVQVNKLPSNVKTHTVTCESGIRARSVSGRGSSAPQMIDATGAFNGDVTVTFNTPGWELKTATNPVYVRRVYFTAVDPVTRATFDYFRWDDVTAGAAPPRSFPTATGTTPVLVASGPIPLQS
jgi:hypothetical protein